MAIEGCVPMGVFEIDCVGGGWSRAVPKNGEHFGIAQFTPLAL